MLTRKNICDKIQVLLAGVVKLANTYDSGSYGRKSLRVQVPSSAPKKQNHLKGGSVIFVHPLLTNTNKKQHLIQQVFNVSENESFFTDFLDFVEKNNYHHTTRIAVK